MRRLLAWWIVVLGLLPVGLAAAESPRPALHGGWVATAGATVFRGRWIAQALSTGPNAVGGSWTLLTGADETVLAGTWAAQKAGRGWRGTWSARTEDGARSFSGSWEADGAGFGGKTFEELLAHAAEKQIAGSWRSGPARGNWWLKG